MSLAGDVYHLIFDLSQKIHGRVWLEKDRPAVKRLLSLIQHVCGAHFPHLCILASVSSCQAWCRLCTCCVLVAGLELLFSTLVLSGCKVSIGNGSHARERPCVCSNLSILTSMCGGLAGVQPTATFSTEKEGDVVNCLPVQLPVACLGVPAAERRGLRGRSRTFVHKSYLLRWVSDAPPPPVSCSCPACSRTATVPFTLPGACGKACASVTSAVGERRVKAHGNIGPCAPARQSSCIVQEAFDQMHVAAMLNRPSS